MEIDVAGVMTRLVAVAVLLVAVACIIMIWMAATGHPAYHIPWVGGHEGA
jgi:hypothetical protein